MSTRISAAGLGPVTASMLALAAVGFTLQFGISNVPNLAYGDTMTAAGYAVYLANRQGLACGRRRQRLRHGLYAHQRVLSKAALLLGTDISSQGARATVVKAFHELRGTLVASEQLSPNQASYRTEAQQVIAAKPDVSLTEADPQTGATFMAELKQLGHLVPCIGTGGTIQPPWLRTVSGVIGAASMAVYYQGLSLMCRSAAPHISTG